MPNTVAEPYWLHVVAAVIHNSAGEILLARRLSHQHQGGKWEFPGGKVELDEQPKPALVRELYEELGLKVDAEDLQSFIEVRHCYPDKAIFLDVYQLLNFTGEAYGLEGQEVAWLPLQALADMPFPEANKPILDKLRQSH